MSPADSLDPIRRGSESPVWPLAVIDGRTPVVMPTTCRNPRGIELAYSREPRDRTTYPIGSPTGTVDHVMPSFTPALCVGDGEIMFAGKTADCFAVVVNHRDGWATYYSNLEHMFAVPTDRAPRRVARVKSGDVLGYVGSMQPRGFKCLYFELWRRDPDAHFVSVDPLPFMKDWLRLPWPSHNAKTAAPARVGGHEVPTFQGSSSNFHIDLVSSRG